MKVVSTHDLKLIPELAHFSLFDLINPDNDAVVNEFLWTMGLDIDRPLEYDVSYHRTLTKKSVVGFVIIGEVRTDRQFRLSPWCTAEDRMIAAGKKDVSLARELAAMMNIQNGYGSEQSLEDEEVGELFQDQSEIERIEDELTAMKVVLDNIRGNQYKRNGTRKLAHEYHEQEPYQRERRKKKNRTTLKHRFIED
jgi:hypothetical protein